MTVWFRILPNSPWSRPNENTEADDFLFVRATRPFDSQPAHQFIFADPSTQFEIEMNGVHVLRIQL